MAKLRLDVNYECNYNCEFCHHDQVGECRDKKHLNADDYDFLVKIAKKCDIDCVTLSGGEPTLRKDINSIIDAISSNDVFLKMITNGYNLDKVKNIEKLNVLAISLHTLEYEKYHKITGTKSTLSKVISNLYDLRQSKMKTQLQINMVAIREKSINFDNLRKVLDFCAENNAVLKIIELIDEKSKDFISITEVQKIIENLGFRIKEKKNNKIFYTNSKVDVIIQKCFCNYAKYEENTCELCKMYNDLFVLPNGKVQICRKSTELIDLYPSIKARDEEQLESLIIKCKNLLGISCCYTKKCH